ncbi:MAG: NAD(P)H-dependent oxidoreductase subunit E [Clostridiales Family XIII bacterium]|jgi:NADH-quinone oxidoreductase subunit E|nr:NAD(P)H-dependent oxidoreductase subunit E [Clostridiales Family XIII bacterium]
MPRENKTECLCGSSECSNYAGLDAIIDKYIDMEGNLIIILQEAQELFGYLSRDTVAHISKRTGHAQAKIFGVATFYAQFRLSPIGQNLIMLCQGTACHVNGSEAIEKVICDELGIKDGETTEDGIFTLNNVACLGCCSLAPVMMIQNAQGEETYGKLTQEGVIGILREIKARAVAQSA